MLKYVTIELSFFSDNRINKFIMLSGLKHFDAQARLINLFKSTIIKKCCELSRDEILDSSTYGDEKFDIVDCLIKANLIKDVGDEKFYIKGTSERLQRIDNLSKIRSCNSMKRWENHANRCKPMQTDANLCKPMQTDANLCDRDRDRDKEEISDRLLSSSKTAVSDFEKTFLEVWNLNCGVLPKIKAVTKTRKKKMKIRFNEKPDFEYWEQLVLKMAKSVFCCEGQWATFDWLIKNEENHTKVSECYYDNKKENLKTNFLKEDKEKNEHERLAKENPVGIDKLRQLRRSNEDCDYEAEF